ncbi:MAG: hypothetical protein HY236_10920 [Acidobacteria bacterium]|nr:hypothetical protein [Acidobacteriota bacterium]
MEWCVHIAGTEDLEGELSLERLAGMEPSAKLQPSLELTAQVIQERFGSVRFTRCTFGTEFCEHLLPSPEALEAVRSAARERGLAFTFLTPYVSDSGICKLRGLLRLLDGDEVVFSDWGVLRLLRQEFPRLTPVQGRLLNKSLRDPRVMGVYGETETSGLAPAATLDALRRSNLDSESYTRFLSRMVVAGIEMDNLPQGNDLGFAGRGMPLAVYLPFGFISTSRVCLAAGLHYRKPDKFQPGAPCRHECQTHLVEYAYTNSPFANRDQKFYLKGNTYFYVHTAAMLRSLVGQAAEGRIARLVFQPRLPMLQAHEEAA